MLGVSYDFRSGGAPTWHFDALHKVMMSQRVNWMLDADIRSLVDSVDYEWLRRWWRTGSLILRSYGSLDLR
jgi:RNA-directed DNA polymerase